MEIILIILAVALLAGIIGLIVYKKRQEQVFDETPVAPAVKERSEPEPIQAQNTLDKAEQFISEQRYDNAIQELKRILINDSNHQDAMLKLLQVYGITNNHKAFEQLHQKIHETGNDDIIQQADFCRSLLEEELTHTPTPATPKPVKDIDIDTLEFDIGENSTTPSTSKETDDFDLDIDSLANTEQNSQDTALDDFASSFDEPKVSTDNTALLDDDLLLGDDLLSQTSNQTASDDLLLGDDFFDLEQSVAQDTDTLSANDSLDDLAFDLDSTTSADNDSVVDLSDDNSFDLTFDEPTPTSANDTSLDLQGSQDDTLSLDANLNNSLDDNLGFELDNLDTQADDTQITFDAQETQQDTLSLDDSLTFDSNNVSDDSLSLDDTLSLDSDLANDNLSFDNDLSLDDSLSFDETDSQTDTQLDDFGVDFVSQTKPNTDDVPLQDIDTLTQTEQADTLQSADVSADDSLISDDFSFELDQKTDDLTQDNSQIQLGETQNIDTDFGFDTSDISSNNTSDSNTADNSFDFTLDDTTSPDTAETTAQPADTNSTEFGFDFDDSQSVISHEPLTTHIQQVEPSVDTASTAIQASETPAVATVSHMDSFTDDLSFANNLDPMQVTLDLANRYLNLGEQDSAKRLFEEVLASGNNKQRETAQASLSRL